MGAHGVFAHVKAPSNSGFAAALGDKHGNLGLAFRQAKVSPQALKPRDLGGAEGNGIGSIEVEGCGGPHDSARRTRCLPMSSKGSGRSSLTSGQRRVGIHRCSLRETRRRLHGFCSRCVASVRTLRFIAARHMHRRGATALRCPNLLRLCLAFSAQRPCSTGSARPRRPNDFLGLI